MEGVYEPSVAYLELMNRHWVPEGGNPKFEVRPLAGAADDAVMEGAYDYWRLADEFDRRVGL